MSASFNFEATEPWAILLCFGGVAMAQQWYKVLLRMQVP